jgi:thiopurine S-methyltransferase
MHPQHWLDRWEEGRIGFHQAQTNPHLARYWSQLGARGPVFVPLCGKSLDMLWLRAHGHEVLGIELAPRAVEDFFSENRLEPEVRQQGPFKRWARDGLVILQGDFFDLRAGDLAGITGVYDRASLIALPPEMRRDYVRQMQQILPQGFLGLLITMEYPDGEMAGPPFPVGEAEVRDLYAEAREIRLLHDFDALAENPDLAQRGLSRMHEKV